MSTAVTIGEGTILLSCLKVLQEHGFIVTAVFSDTLKVAQYCEDRSIQVFPRSSSLCDVLSFNKPCYIFSINNPRVLKEAEIRLAQCLAINYHDSLLPSYSGVNSTSWALINGEIIHGVSWHVINSGIDTGAILQTESVDILPEDTAFTLNLKCQEASKRTFKLLLEDIQKNTLSPIEQDLSKRSYYGLNDQLPNLGLLDFDISCERLYNFVRGLEYGHHENRLGAAKVQTETGEFLLVKSAEPTREGKTDAHMPGFILQTKDDIVTVSTGTTPINLCIARLNGSHIQPGKYKKIGLDPGHSLLSMSLVSDAPFHVNIKRKEHVWRKRLVVYEPFTFFQQKMNVISNIIDVSDSVNIKRTTICTLDRYMEVRQCQAYFLAFLARVCCTQDLSVGILSDKSAFPDNCKPLYADICPFMVDIKLSSASQDIIQKIKSKLDSYHLDKPFLKDLVYRYPDVNQRGRSPFHNLVLGEDGSEYLNDFLQNCNVLILFSATSADLSIVYNRRPGQDYCYIIETLRYFPKFLNAVLAAPAWDLSGVSLVSDEEIEIVERYEETHNQSSIVEEFQKISSEHANSVALKTTSISFTYRKCYKITGNLSKLIADSLNRTKQQHHFVAIHLPSSTSYIFSVLATIHCGLTFVPIAEDLPDDRVKFILNDGGIYLMLTSQKILDFGKLQAVTKTFTVLLKSKVGDEFLVLVEWERESDNSSSISGLLSVTESCDQDETKKQSTEGRMCYAMYTSGSTGKPKGVLVKESSVFNMAKAQINSWNLQSTDTIAQFASIGFDASVSEIFTALLSGGTLAVLDKNQRLGKEFVRAVFTLGVTVITLPPSLLNILSPGDLPNVKTVVTAGEACTLNTAVMWTRGTGKRFFNAYGPTETTVCATIFDFNPKKRTPEANQDLPIGRPISGVVVYLLDDFLKPVPYGVVGQMYIGGKGVSAGYIGHAHDRNAESFVQNPLSTRKCTLYKTGDHAFKDSNGNFTFVGRMDDQVKLRGHRINLSEIEQVLIQHIMVQIAVVVVHKCTKSGHSTLAAFIAPDVVFVSELREYLAKVLPKYMIPTYIKKMKSEDFPLTLSGKIDRQALVKDETIHDQKLQVGHSHLNETQLDVAKLLCEVLKLDDALAYSLYRMSSFSELGGNSLHLVLLQRALEDHFRIHLSFADIGSADTVEEFADVVERKQDSILIPEVSHCKTDQLKSLILSDSDLKLDADNGEVLGVEITKECAQPIKGTRIPMTILVSGVTGFLGAFLLSELLECTFGNICCMVRETTEVKGFGKLIENMRKYNLWKFEYRNRIAIVLSDLTKPKLGIAPDIYNSLTHDVDAIFVNAAKMNFNTDYEDHRAANVLGTKEFIKFAVTNKRKYLFSTSSLSVFLFPRERMTASVLSETDFFDDPTIIEGGYGQSKWASERLVMQALDLLPGGAIFRPARVSGTSTDGLGPHNDLFACMLKGMKSIGSYPELDFPFDLTPVDFCARAMVEIACKIRLGGGDGKRVFHIFNKDTFPFCDMFTGLGLSPVSLKQWRRELGETLDRDILPLTPFFKSTFWDRAGNWPVFDTSNTEMFISEETKKLMKPSLELLQKYKKFFKIE